ncbi:hydrogenase expression protein HypF [Wenjunlia tyrosinilytica]|uniref:hydrogenase expression protein HypF n=1 Tax=Wenjunlia tyrosinilytica TaxID=1544741 RepID=UPI001E3BF238|nr:hydrogenase expression protein HypF [Wenjunlia tyrosinilytica]
MTHVQNRPTTGPRHAAPKKALLTRLQIPAGKAIAIAAMPTAVLMGMGLTPRLAQADETPGKNSFKPGPCVTASDSPSPSAQAKDAKDGKDAESTKDSNDGKGGASASPSHSSKPGKSPTHSPKPGKSPTSVDPSADGPGDDNSKPEPKPSQSTTPAPQESEHGGILDPILDPLGDILTGGHSDDGAKPEPSDSATPTPSATPSKPGSEGKPGGGGDGGTTGPKADATKPSDDADKPGGSDDDAPGKPRPKNSASPSPSASASPSEDASPTPDPDGKTPYPCPEEGHVKGDNEQTPNILPKDPWTLKASRLGLHGLKYDGVVNVRTSAGTTKQALKFRASGIDIGDLHQLVDGPLGVTMHIEARSGSTSTIRGGEVTMYTEKLSGKLLGIIPITFTPESPPPLTLPELFFTDVTVVQAGQFGGNLTVPGLHGYSTK